MKIENSLEISPDDLCQDLHLGHEYTVVGIFDPSKNFFNVWSISSAAES
jgi:hypothetical protein